MFTHTHAHTHTHPLSRTFLPFNFAPISVVAYLEKVGCSTNRTPFSSGIRFCGYSWGWNLMRTHICCSKENKKEHTHTHTHKKKKAMKDKKLKGNRNCWSSITMFENLKRLEVQNRRGKQTLFLFPSVSSRQHCKLKTWLL